MNNIKSHNQEESKINELKRAFRRAKMIWGRCPFLQIKGGYSCSFKGRGGMNCEGYGDSLCKTDYRKCLLYKESQIERGDKIE